MNHARYLLRYAAEMKKPPLFGRLAANFRGHLSHKGRGYIIFADYASLYKASELLPIFSGVQGVLW